MNTRVLLILGVAGVVASITPAACDGDKSMTASSTGSSGGGTTGGPTTSAGGGGSGASTSATSAGGAGGAGGGACAMTCADAIANGGDVCANAPSGVQTDYDALMACVCGPTTCNAGAGGAGGAGGANDAGSDACNHTCAGMPEMNPDACTACEMTAFAGVCNTEFVTCSGT